MWPEPQNHGGTVQVSIYTKERARALDLLTKNQAVIVSETFSSRP